MSESYYPVIERVLEAVATRTGTDILDLPPLYDAIDPDALRACLRSMDDGEVSFQYAGCTITVESDGAVEVTD